MGGDLPRAAAATAAVKGHRFFKLALEFIRPTVPFRSQGGEKSRHATAQRDLPPVRSPSEALRSPFESVQPEPRRKISISTPNRNLKGAPY
jgi:hypothetical protein